MKRNLIFALMLLGLLVIAYTPAFAQTPNDVDEEEGMISPEPGGLMEEIIFAEDAGPMMEQTGGPGGGGFGMKVMDELELTKDQRKQLEDITFNFRKGIIPLRAQLQVLNLELQKMIRTDAPRKDIDAQIDQVGKLRTDIQKQAVGNRLAMRAVLTPEQREKWDNRPHMMGKGMGQPMREMMMKRTKEHGGRGKGL